MSETDPRNELGSHHRDTVDQILGHPTSHNIEWPRVLKLLEQIGSVSERHDGKYVVTLGSETEVFDDFGRKDLDTQQVVDLRRMLLGAGFTTEK